MNKTINITIGGEVFNIIDTAFQKLDEYLNTIRSHFSSYEDSEEIVADIESRIAEQFSLRITKQKKVITEQDVDELILSLGRIEDFEEFSDESSEVDNEKPKKRFGKKLYRSHEDKVISGVSAGLAAYIGIEAVIVRIFFVLLFFLFNVFTIILYLVLWASLKEAKTTAQKIEMQGKPLTLTKIEQEIKARLKKKPKDKVDQPESENENEALNSELEDNTGGLKKIITLPFEILATIFKVLKNFFRKFFPVLSIIVGIGMAVATIVTLAVLSFLMVVLALQVQSPYIDTFIIETLKSFDYYALVFSAYAVILVPVILLMLVSLTLIKRRSTFHGPTTLVLVIIWIGSIVFGSAIAFKIAPDVEAQLTEYEESVEQVEQLVELDEFSKIIAGGSNQIKISQGTKQEIKLTGPVAELDRVELTVTGESLRILKDSEFRICFFCRRQPITTEVILPELKSLTLGGAAEAEISEFATEDLSFNLAGAAEASAAAITATKVDVKLSGAAELLLEGEAEELEANLSGASRLKAFDFPSNTVFVRSSGANRAEVHATEDLTAFATGAGTIKYLGNPENIVQDQYGATDIEAVE